MSKTYTVQSYIVHSEIDVFNSGCQGNGFTDFGNCGIFANSITNLIKELQDFTGMQDYELNACEKFGRIDFQGMTLSKFGQSKPRQSTIDKWKRGEINLYLTDFTFLVKLVETELDLQSMYNKEQNNV